MQIIKQDGSILHIYFENPINKIEKYIKNEFNSLTLEKTNGDLHFKIDLVEVAKQFIQYENKKNIHNSGRVNANFDNSK